MSVTSETPSSSPSSPSSTVGIAEPESIQRQIGTKRKAADAGIDTASGVAITTNTNTTISTTNAATSNSRNTKARFFTKRRATKACQCCRARKVRCNVTEHGAPCTNCRLDEVECIVSEGRRRRKIPGVLNIAGNTSVIFTDNCRNQQQRRYASSRSPRRTIDEWLDKESRLDGTAFGIEDDSIAKGRQDMVIDPILKGVAHNETDHSLAACPATLPSEANSQFHGSPTFQPSDMCPPLPSFVKPLPSRIKADDITYLERKGALFVPTDDVLSEMLRCYVEFVHHSNPVLDLRSFLSCISVKDGSHGQVSLLVLHAVLYAACAFVNMDWLRRIGYRSRKDARQHFYNKVKLLYDLDCETDRLVLVQGLSLITDHYDRPNDLGDAHYWLGIVLSIAKSIGLHNNPEVTHMCSESAKLRKRIWWTLFSRDKLIALGMRRPTLIHDDDFDVPELKIDDMEPLVLTDHYSWIPINCKGIREAATQHRLAVLFLERVKLCCCVGNVLSKTYFAVNENTKYETDRTTFLLRPKMTSLHSKEVKQCHEELHRWLGNLPPEALLDSNFDGKDVSDHTSANLNCAILHMLFHAAVSALHRPRVLLNAVPTPPTSPQLDGSFFSEDATFYGHDPIATSRQSIRQSTAKITSIAHQLTRANLAHHLPVTSITVLVAAMVIHLLDLKSAEGPALKRAALDGFCTCMQIMEILGETYVAADISIAFIDAAIRRGSIEAQTLERDLRPASVEEQGKNAKENDNKETMGEGKETIHSAKALLIFRQRVLGCPKDIEIDSSTPYESPNESSPVSFDTNYAAPLSYCMTPKGMTSNGMGLASMPWRRMTLGSLTPPPEEDLSVQKMGEDDRAKIAIVDRKYENINGNSGLPYSNSCDADMLRRLQRYLAGLPPQASDVLGEGNSASNVSRTNYRSAGKGAVASTNSDYGSIADNLDEGIDINACGTAGMSNVQLENDFDALIDLSAGAGDDDDVAIVDHAGETKDTAVISTATTAAITLIG